MATVWRAVFGEGSLDAASEAGVTALAVVLIGQGGAVGTAFAVLLVVWAWAKARKDYWMTQLVQEYELRYGRL